MVTPVHNLAWGLLRFGTGDMSAYTIEPCPCGRTAHRLVGILGRTGDAVKVRGMFVVAKQAEEALGAFEPVSRFQLVVSRPGQRDEVVLRLELRDEPADRGALQLAISQRVQGLCRVRVDRTEFVPPGAIGEGQPLIRDERTWD